MRALTAKNIPLILLAGLFVLTLFLSALEGSEVSPLSLGTILSQWPMALWVIAAPLLFAVVRYVKFPSGKIWLAGFYISYTLILLVDLIWVDALIRRNGLGESGLIWASAPFVALFAGFGIMAAGSIGHAIIGKLKR